MYEEKAIKKQVDFQRKKEVKQEVNKEVRV